MTRSDKVSIFNEFAAGRVRRKLEKEGLTETAVAVTLVDTRRAG